MNKIITSDRQLVVFDDSTQLGPNFVLITKQQEPSVLFNIHHTTSLSKGMFAAKGDTKEEAKQLTEILKNQVVEIVYTPKGLREAFPDVFCYACEPSYENTDNICPIEDSLDSEDTADSEENDYRNKVIVREVKPNRMLVTIVDVEDLEYNKPPNLTNIMLHFDYISAIFLPSVGSQEPLPAPNIEDPFDKES
jgi:hypothetical protein